MVKRIVLLLIVIALAIAGGAYYKFQAYLSSKPSTEHEERIVQIPRGASVLAIGKLLESEGILEDARLFYYYVRFKKASKQVKAGELVFHTDLTPPEVLAVLVKGDEVRHKLTFPEGYNIRDMGAVVSALPFLDGERFVALASDPKTARQYGFTTPTLEGFLFPSTYELTRSQDESVLISAMVRQFKSHWTPELAARANELKMTQLEVVTLASIIEKETGHADERPLVGSVFHNRLETHMKLQSDPTIIYGLKDFDGNIRREDIRKKHPWNTYVIPGLPPSPIANPGLASIRAALWPADSDYLFFVARGDSTHSFSATYAEHAKKVYRYQVKGLRR